MKLFLDARPASQSSAEPCVNVTSGYIEFSYPCGEEDAVNVYVVPRSRNQIFILCCLDHAFDFVFKELNGGTLGTIVDTWPTLALLLSNGIHDRYNQGALIRLADEDDGETKWFLATVVANISTDDLNHLFTERTYEAIRLVLEKTQALMNELAARKPSVGKRLFNGMLDGLSLNAATMVACTNAAPSSA